jgi:hypothetical protein
MKNHEVPELEIEPSSERSNSEQEPKKKYTYRDNKTPDRDIVFECLANDILEADAMFKAETGKDPAKLNHIACSFEKIGE